MRFSPMTRERCAPFGKETRKKEEAAMLVKCHAAMRVIALLAPVLLYAAPAASQSDSQRTGVTQGSGVPQAPVGHRQPKAADIPKERPKDAADEQREKLDRELDAKLRICRNC
jgi:hypothetical protein